MLLVNIIQSSLIQLILKYYQRRLMNMVTVKVLGSGCANCAKLEKTARQAIAQLGIPANVEKVTDYAQIMRYNVLQTPALVVNEKLVSAGRQPSIGEITTWLTNVVA